MNEKDELFEKKKKLVLKRYEIYDELNSIHIELFQIEKRYEEIKLQEIRDNIVG